MAYGDEDIFHFDQDVPNCVFESEQTLEYVESSKAADDSAFGV